MDIDPGLPRLIITPGEPAGIGPDILVKAIQQPVNADLVVTGDPSLFRERARLLNLPLRIEEFNPDADISLHKPGEMKLIPVSLQAHCKPGFPESKNAEYVLQTLELACKACLSNEFTAMVTAPVNKAILNQAGYSFTGHTEYLAKICGSGYPVMLLANEKLKIALATTHVPLAEVSSLITADRLERVIDITFHDLKYRFDIYQPRLLVCGLNPHAGEEGHLGREEIDIILPLVNQLKERGMDLTGPVPADSAFTREMLEGIDAVICMFHDQGLPVIKSTGFGETVNITLGLPVIRTSVDHGTAISLAGTGKASHSSMMSAINSAIQLSQNSSSCAHIEEAYDHAKSYY